MNKHEDEVKEFEDERELLSKECHKLNCNIDDAFKVTLSFDDDYLN